jgi:hypothetical protein
LLLSWKRPTVKKINTRTIIAQQMARTESTLLSVLELAKTRQMNIFTMSILSPFRHLPCAKWSKMKTFSQKLFLLHLMKLPTLSTTLSKSMHNSLPMMIALKNIL